MKLPLLNGVRPFAMPDVDELDRFREDDYGFAFFHYAAGGPGWYWWLDDYPDEGVCGPFQARDDAVAHAREMK